MNVTQADTIAVVIARVSLRACLVTLAVIRFATRETSGME
jgi:hypothetical protein